MTPVAGEDTLAPSQIRGAGRFELRCADVHPVRCAEVWRSRSAEEVVARAREHGADTHGFTAVWYSPQRIGEMLAAVTSS
jgi:predicted small metal-binding protein